MKSLMRSLRNLGVGAGLLLCGGLVAAPALADTITYSFGGTVTSGGSGLPMGEFSPSTPMSGSMTVDTTDRNPKGNGRYVIQDFTVTIGDFTATMEGSSGRVNIRNASAPLSKADRFSVRVNNLAGEDPDGLINEDPRLFTIDLRGQSDIFSSGDLPSLSKNSLPPSVAAFGERNRFRLQFGPDNADSRAVIGELTSLSAVPLPASVILFGVGLVALIGLNAGRLRNIQLPQA